MAGVVRVKKNNFRIDYDLEKRLMGLPQEVGKAIYYELTDDDGEYRVNRDRWRYVLTGQVAYMYDYEVRVFCKHIGCTIFELMDFAVDLLPIYLKKKTQDEAKYAFEQYGLTKS